MAKRITLPNVNGKRKRSWLVGTMQKKVKYYSVTY